MMKFLMLGARHYFQVFNSVVSFYLVNVVDYFFFVKSSADMILHNQSVLSYSATSGSMNYVSVRNSAESFLSSSEDGGIISFISVIMFQAKTFCKEVKLTIEGFTFSKIFRSTHESYYNRNIWWCLC